MTEQPTEKLGVAKTTKADFDPLYVMTIAQRVADRKTPLPIRAADREAKELARILENACCVIYSLRETIGSFRGGVGLLFETLREHERELSKVLSERSSERND